MTEDTPLVTEDTPLTKAIRGHPESNDSMKTVDLNYDRVAKIVDCWHRECRGKRYIQP